jgi:squalene synthase HpnC
VTDLNSLQSGKGHRDENFPVASILIPAQHRPIILAFYRFARAADDVADHPTSPPAEKLRLLEDLRASLTGEANNAEPAVDLRKVLAQRSMSARHALDLLEAFRRDVTVSRYPDWSALMDYCRYSAMPVGRFVLDVHGEPESLWPANDALCAALQMINHLQDCKEDLHQRDRVYIPEDLMHKNGVTIEALSAENSSARLKRVFAATTNNVAALLRASRPFAQQIKTKRLGLEVGIIQGVAEHLNRRLAQSDPLADRIHHSTFERAMIALRATATFAAARITRPRITPDLAGSRQ